MKKEYLNVILADDNEGNLILFKNILQEFKVQVKVKTFCNGKDLMTYLNENIVVPEVVFLNYYLPLKNSMECLSEIKSDQKFDPMTIIVFNEDLSYEQEEEAFVTGANVIMKTPDNYRDMKKSITDIISITWQYHTSGLNKNNFIMKV
ncbi:response regulator [Chryseobacterium takakiae]|uniref:Response regulator receiver domain-containing protein n=1 Tax=Chryseobacterium takakiae TaxID=1302685 RepID=A0A1M5BC08_9FLAO|nr:response regulator [Chryseobacterium takakiae]SHF39955.1 Response regulator receiver domain-containing protein [Chryseobacterium takakiae]